MISVHNVRECTQIPDELMSGFGREMLTESLSWVAEDWETGRVYGTLFAFGAHNFFYPVRIMVAKDAPRLVAYTLMRKAVLDARRSGFKFFLTHLEPTPRGEKLKKIAERHGAIQVDGGWVGGHLDTMLRLSRPQRDDS